MTTRPRIALDADGVLLDFNLGYARAWERAFGHYPREVDPQAYHPMHRFEVTRLDPSGREHFRRHFDEVFWSSLSPLEGALQACHRLHEAGFELVCVSALDARFEAGRLRNLRAHGFPIDRVMATGHFDGSRSPKAAAIDALRPVAFVDDYLPYLRGIDARVHTALVLREPNGSPNTGDEVALLARSWHQDLAEFTDYWLDGRSPAAVPSPLPSRVTRA